jgi:hypothetical protein
MRGREQEEDGDWRDEERMWENERGEKYIRVKAKGKSR